MEQFLGEYPCKLDDKGRLLLPAKFRKEFATGIAITRSPDGCLRGYRIPDFMARLEKLQRADDSGRRARRQTRMLASAAADQTPDSQGRVLIPPTLRKYAGLDRDIMVAGCGQYLEIWSSAAWAEELAAAEAEFAALDVEEADDFF